MNPTPNILMILVDERRADALGCFGNGIIRTPNLDRLAAGGTRFSQCMVTQPTCTPCRASLLTGCFPSALRSRMVGCETPDDPRFLPRALGAAGYRTASIGKIHLVPQAWEPEAIEKTRQADGTYDYYGFREVELVNGHGDRCFGPNFTPWVERRLAECGASRHPRKPLCGIPDCYEWPLPPELHSTPYIADRTTEFLRDAASRERPFFLHCSFPDPHHPFTVPEPYASMYDPDDMPDPLPPPDDDGDPPPPVCAAYRNEKLSNRPSPSSKLSKRGSSARFVRRFSFEAKRILRRGWPQSSAAGSLPAFPPWLSARTKAMSPPARWPSSSTPPSSSRSVPRL